MRFQIFFQIAPNRFDVQKISDKGYAVEQGEAVFQQFPVSSAGLIKIHPGTDIIGRHHPHFSIGIGKPVEQRTLSIVENFR